MNYYGGLGLAECCGSSESPTGPERRRGFGGAVDGIELLLGIIADGIVTSPEKLAAYERVVRKKYQFMLDFYSAAKSEIAYPCDELSHPLSETGDQLENLCPAIDGFFAEIKKKGAASWSIEEKFGIVSRILQKIRETGTSEYIDRIGILNRG